jgi:hypothetical protein
MGQVILVKRIGDLALQQDLTPVDDRRFWTPQSANRGVR